MTDSTSTTLLEGLRGIRNEQAWTRFVEVYRPLLERYAARRGLGENDKEEVVQLSMVAVVSGFRNGSYDCIKGRFRDWLRGIVDHQIAGHFESLRRFPQLLPEGCGAAFLDDLASRQEDHQHAWEMEWRRYVADSLMMIARARFSKQTLTVVERIIADGEPCQRVADSLGMELNAVYQALDRVKRRLRKVARALDLEL